MADNIYQVGYSVPPKNKVVGFFLSSLSLGPASALIIPLKEEVKSLVCFHTFSPPF